MGSTYGRSMSEETFTILDFDLVLDLGRWEVGRERGRRKVEGAAERGLVTAALCYKYVPLFQFGSVLRLF